MGAGRGPDGKAPLREEVVRESAVTQVTRLVFAGHTVIRKRPLGTDADRRVRHEKGILESLGAVSGLAQLVDYPGFPDSILLADVGRRSLADAAKPLPIDELLRMALALARAVAGMHARGVMHRDISPANIVLADDDGAPTLVGLTLATSLTELSPPFSHPFELVGTLEYLAPEATGRTGWPVDHRADLYALGAVLYELATGAPPFGVGDPLRLTRDHLVRVPQPPNDLNPAIPAPLAAIVMHLLEKEPADRYQTDQGLLADLHRLESGDALAANAFEVGAQDFPLRLPPTSRLIGRDDEFTALVAAFDDAQVGRCRAVLVGGVSGVGKSALLNQLRPVVSGAEGWFVAGKFDQYRRDFEVDAVHQAVRALGRLMLALPEEELAEVRQRILTSVRANTGLLAATTPELATLMTVAEDPGDPLTAQVRAQRAVADLLRAVASPERPLVIVLDDMQWASRTALGFVDLVLSEDPIEGLLLGLVFRDDNVYGTQTLAEMFSRWRYQPGVRTLRLDNLSATSLAAMVAQILTVPVAAARGLAGILRLHTAGNPYQTAELLGALRRAGVLTTSPKGWRWDAAAVRAHLGDAEAASLPAARVNALPESSRALMQAMACLGGQAEAGVLQVATGEPDVERALGPALEDHLLEVEPGAQLAVRIRHDRLREAILTGLDPSSRRRLQLAIARRLASVPAMHAIAARQYLPVIDTLDDPAERRRVVALLCDGAEHASLTGDHPQVISLLTAALSLMDAGDPAALAAAHVARHAALCSLGRLDEGDEDYRIIGNLCPAVLQRAQATVMQVRSLTHRNRHREALQLGIESLRELGIIVPAPEALADDLERHCDRLYRWLYDTDASDDLLRPTISDQAVTATSSLINATLVPAFFTQDVALHVWLSLEALRILIEHGPGPALVGPACQAAFATIAAVAVSEDYLTAYRCRQRLLALAEARGYEPDTSEVRFLFALLSCWVEPIENGVEHARRARDGLVAACDMANAAYTHHMTAYLLLDCDPTLDDYAAEVKAGSAFMRRTGNEQTGQLLEGYRWLVDELRGRPSAVVGEPDPVGSYAANPAALFEAHLARALAAAIFGDSDSLQRHIATAVPLLPAAMGLYPTAIAHLLHGLALAWQLGHSDSLERDELVSELDKAIRWLNDRAADAPANFAHLVRLLEAERSWALGDPWGAALAFDAARRETADGRRPWHRALVCERAARFHLAHGLEHVGSALLGEARSHYEAWGALAKVAQLDWAFPSRGPELGQHVQAATVADAGPNPPPITGGTLDLLGIVSVSQALSSETSLEKLHVRVVDVLGALTGATAVHLLLWNEDDDGWLLPSLAGLVPIGARHESAVPLSVLRYIARTRKPLVVGDTTADDRFARDPYLTDADRCSLLALPILSRGALRAVLVLENRLLRDAFTTNRIEALKLIAGQLAVSLDNARLYDELTASRARIVTAADATRRRIERDLHDGAQQRLIAVAFRLRVAQAELPPGADHLQARLGDLAADVTGAVDELREIARGLHPAALAFGGLPHALSLLADRSAVPVILDVRLDGRLPHPIELAAYYAVAESLTNTAKHANASAVEVALRIDRSCLHLRVHDDGRGGADFHRGSGLLGIKDRIETLGGRVTFYSPAGAGTTVEIELPLHAHEAPLPPEGTLAPDGDRR